MKDYFCKDCPENNNGWCKLHKKQGLKNIEFCPDKPSDQIEESESVDVDTVKEAFRQIGQRNMFNNIQRQMLSIEKDDKVKDKFSTFIRVMVNLEKMLQVHESIFKVDKYIDNEIDRDIMQSSKNISKHWNNKYGGYEG